MPYSLQNSTKICPKYFEIVGSAFAPVLLHQMLFLRSSAQSSELVSRLRIKKAPTYVGAL
jgi:hypothetical protein